MVIGAANLQVSIISPTRSDWEKCWDLSIDMVVAILWNVN